jgi:uncharacterized protein DUF2490
MSVRLSWHYYGATRLLFEPVVSRSEGGYFHVSDRSEGTGHGPQVGHESIEQMTTKLPATVRCACVAGMLFVCAADAHAQQKTETQILPEFDVHYEFSSRARVYLQAKDDRDGGDPQQFTFGPSILFYRKPLMNMKQLLTLDLDTTKSRPVVVETGYRVITAPSAAVENRMIEAVTFHYPLLNQVLITDRNRFDLDWQSGRFTWRYRNRLMLERMFSIRSFHLAPYVAAEPFYESQYSKWASTDLYAGSTFPVGKHLEIEAYYEHENDTGKSPNRQKNFVGLKAQLYFSRKKGAKAGN